MIYVFDGFGQIVRVLHVPASEAGENVCSHESWVASEEIYEGRSFYISGGEFFPIPPQPSFVHFWNWEEKSWVLMEGALGNICARRLKEIGRLCFEYQEQPVTYAGILFDADAAARENIGGVVARISRGDGLTVGWIGWRTFDNTMVWGDESSEGVLMHLQGICRLIEDRKQSLISAAWAHKAAVLALNSVDAVQAYDITVGWPV